MDFYNFKSFGFRPKEDLKMPQNNSYTNKIIRFLGVIVGSLFMLMSPIMIFSSQGSLLSVLSMFLMGVVFVYFGFTNRSIVKDTFHKWLP